MIKTVIKIDVTPRLNMWRKLNSVGQKLSDPVYCCHTDDVEPKPKENTKTCVCGSLNRLYHDSPHCSWWKWISLISRLIFIYSPKIESFFLILHHCKTLDLPN